MAKTKAEEKTVDKQPKKISVSEYPLKLVEKHYNRKSLEGYFQKEIQTAVNRTEPTVTTESGNVILRTKTYFRTNCMSDRKEERTGTANRR